MLLMRIADRQSVSLSYVMENYTASEVKYWQIYLAKEPNEGIRNQYLMTQLLSMFHAANFKGKNKAPSDFSYPYMWKSFIEQDVDTIRALLHGK